MDRHRTRTWAEIDLDALEHNYRIIRRGLEPGCRFLGLCKANAYGHGAVEVGRRLAELGCEMLAVACLEEGISLRSAGIEVPILVLGPTVGAYASLLLEHDLTQTVCSETEAQMLSQAAVAAGKKLAVHIKIDTGMTRLGLLWQEETEKSLIAEIGRMVQLPGLVCEGLFTHFADASCNEDFTMQQFSRFLRLREGLAQGGIPFKICHCANSGAVLHYPCTHLDMVRPGIILYGYCPEPGDEGLCDEPLRPVMKLYTRISQLRTAPRGAAVSYGCTQVLQRESQIAVLPIGYGDGYSRLFSSGMEVLLRGIRCPVVGRVCMDMCMIDVTDVPDAAVGDVAMVYGAEGLAEQGALMAGTIPYELLCNVSARVPRIYLDPRIK